MSGDPSRRPSNERIRVAGVDARIWVECDLCLGDGWVRFNAWHRVKQRCGNCDGVGRRQILALHRSPRQRIVGPPEPMPIRRA